MMVNFKIKCFLLMAGLLSLWSHAVLAGIMENDTFHYSGQAVADARQAELTFEINGKQVQGKMSAQGIKAPNVRLAGFTLTFRGTLSGPWEDDNTQISATWSGVDHFEPDQPNEGTLLIFMKKTETGSKHVHVRVTGRRGQYGWLFPPCGRVVKLSDSSTVTPEISPPDKDVSGPDPSGTQPSIELIDSDLLPSSDPYSQSNAAERWENARKQLPEAIELNDTEIQRFKGMITMMVDDEREVFWGSWNTHVVRATGDLKEGAFKVIELGRCSMYCGPAGVALASDLKSRNVHIKALKKGVAKLVMSQEIKVMMPDGKEYWASGSIIYIIVVREPEMGAAVNPDISRVVITGKAEQNWRHGTRVADAMVSLVIHSGLHKGGGYNDPAWITGKDGRFTIEARNIPSAQYEILIQKIGTHSTVPGSLVNSGSKSDRFDSGEIGMEDDLWPIHQYIIRLTSDIAAQGPIDVGIILMDPVREVFPTSSYKSRNPVFINPGSGQTPMTGKKNSYGPVIIQQQ